MTSNASYKSVNGILSSVLGMSCWFEACLVPALSVYTDYLLLWKSCICQYQEKIIFTFVSVAYINKSGSDGANTVSVACLNLCREQILGSAPAFYVQIKMIRTSVKWSRY